MKITTFITICFISICIISCNHKDVITSSSDEFPTLILRLSSENTESDEQWAATFKAIKDNPGCCDEVWFSSGLGVRPLDWHRDNARRMASATKELNELGIKGSVQLQSTIGHGDHFGYGREYCFSEKKWTGWTGSTGVEAKFCNCPSQQDYIAYMKNVAKIYAEEIKPYSMWIDDDLRFENHSPATNGSKIGCWCNNCISEFNRENNSNWTRETLNAAIEKDEQLALSWRKFSTATLAHLAEEIAISIKEVSPNTCLGFQHTYWEGLKDYISSILKTLNKVSKKPVSYRPGGGDYYDMNDACGQICKSMEAADFRRIMGNPDFVGAWVPEIESWPRVYGGRTGQGVLVEAFTAIAYGMDGVSYFTISSGVEDDELYSRYMLRPIGLAAPVLHKYRDENKGTKCIGYSINGNRGIQLETARLGIPIVKGMSDTLACLKKEDVSINVFDVPFREVQALRNKIDQQYHCPVFCCSPYLGLIIPRIDTDGKVKTIGLLNPRIDSQYDIRIRIDNDSINGNSVFWYEMKKAPIELPITNDGNYSYVDIPEISAWNGGFLLFACQ